MQNVRRKLYTIVSIYTTIGLVILLYSNTHSPEYRVYQQEKTYLKYLQGEQEMLVVENRGVKRHFEHSQNYLDQLRKDYKP